jgi:hypothetical protein
LESLTKRDRLALNNLIEAAGIFLSDECGTITFGWRRCGEVHPAATFFELLDGFPGGQLMDSGSGFADLLDWKVQLERTCIA